jgi:hypothetical protein
MVFQIINFNKLFKTTLKDLIYFIYNHEASLSGFIEKKYIKIKEILIL